MPAGRWLNVEEDDARERKIADLETALARAKDAERQARQRADLLERSMRTAWNMSWSAPRQEPCEREADEWRAGMGRRLTHSRPAIFDN